MRCTGICVEKGAGMQHLFKAVLLHTDQSTELSTSARVEDTVSV